jgi:hypothetical protein
MIMKYALVIVFIIAILFVVLLFLLRLNYESENKVKYKQRSDMLNDSIVNIRDILLSSNQIESRFIENLVVTNIRNKQYGPIYDVISRSSDDVLIIRLLNTTCGSCQLKQAEMIKMLEHKRPIILSCPGDARKLILYMKTHRIDIPIYQINSESKILPEDDVSRLLIMVVSSDGAIRRAYYLREKNMFMVNFIL